MTNFNSLNSRANTNNQSTASSKSIDISSILSQLTSILNQSSTNTNSLSSNSVDFDKVESIVNDLINSLSNGDVSIDSNTLNQLTNIVNKLTGLSINSDTISTLKNIVNQFAGGIYDGVSSSSSSDNKSGSSTSINIDLSEVNNNLKTIAEKEIDFSKITEKLDNISKKIEIISNNIDFIKINENLESLITVLTPTNKQLLQQCAISLYSHADFDNKSPIHLAQEAIDRSIVLVSELQNKKIL